MLEGKEKKRKSQKEHKTRALVCDTPVKKRPIPHRGKKKPKQKHHTMQVIIATVKEPPTASFAGKKKRK